jgi:5'-nucleotidase/UDP-sugar diphosphatase
MQGTVTRTARPRISTGEGSMTVTRLATAALLATVLAACSGSTTEPSRRVRILFTTDEHSHVNGIQPELDDRVPAAGTGMVGGVLRRATVLAENRADGVDTVTVSTGDWSQGTLASAAFAVANFDLSLMKLLGYDAIGIGNHEFDIGPQGLAMAVSAAKARDRLPPLILTNVRFSATSAADDALAALHGARGSGKEITTSRIVTTAGGVKVGILAALGPGAAYDCSQTAAPLTFTEGWVPDAANHDAALAAVAAAAQAEIASLRAEGVDLVLLLGHGGIASGSASSATPDDDVLLVGLLTGVDFVVSGHSHNRPDAVRYATSFDGKQVPVMQPAPYGLQVGRAELVLAPGQAPALDTDPTRTRFIDVADPVVPSTDAALRTEVGTMIAGLEQSFLPATLSVIEGAPVADDPAVVGDLYFRPLGTTTFDVVGVAPGETNALDLDTDAMLAAANAHAGQTLAALQASGAIRGDLLVGQTGQLAFADVYRMVPLGLDPADGTPGYPLVRFHLAAAELRGALELTLGLALSNGDYFVSPSGLVVEYDLTRTPLVASNPLSPGWITRLAFVSPASGAETFVVYDATAFASTGGWASPNPFGAPVPTWLTPLPLVTTYQVGAFAVSMGITPKNADGSATTLAASVVRWPAQLGGTAVKDHQALGAYLKAIAASGLPSRYDGSTAEGHVPRRMVCSGLACP